MESTINSCLSLAMTREQCQYGETCYRRNPVHLSRFAHPGDNDWHQCLVCSLICPCGGGQSCIVDRRLVGDWVHEDDVFKASALPVRLNCFEPLGDVRERAIQCAIKGIRINH